MPIATEKDIKGWLLEVIKPEELNDKDLKTAGVLFEAVISKDKIRETAKGFLAQQYFLEDLTAVDFAECFEIVYHFNHWDRAQRSVVKVLVPKEDNHAPSISHVYRSANWFEREVYDMFGVIFSVYGVLKQVVWLLPDEAVGEAFTVTK